MAGIELGQLRAQINIPLLPENALVGFGLKQHSFSPARRQVQAGIGPRIADHDEAQQPAQFFRLAGLARALGIQKTGAKFLGRRQLPRLEQGDQIIKFFQ